MKNITTTILAGILLISCSKNAAPIVPTNITTEQSVVLQNVLAEFKTRGYYSEALESVSVVLVSREELAAYCETKDLTNGCATERNIFIVDEVVVDFAYMLIHEMFHIALFHQTGDADAGHATQVFPEEVIKVRNNLK